jgi:hypothetical protein
MPADEVYRRVTWQGNIELLQHGQTEARVRAAKALGDMGAKVLIITARELTDPLGKLPQDQETDRKLTLVAARQENFRKRAIDIADRIETVLAAASKDTEEPVRRTATQALVKAKLGRVLVEKLGSTAVNP